ncbi:MAG: hypothetical protein ABJB10_02630 [Mesorhizobium sp.]
MVETSGLGVMSAYLAVGIAGTVVAYLVLSFFRGRSPSSTDVASQRSGQAAFTAVSRDASRLTKIKLVPSYGYQPLATLDYDVVEGLEPDRLVLTARLNDGLDAWRDNYGEIAPDDLNLSADLCRALDDWNWDYQTFFNEIDPTEPHCTPEHEAAHEAEGRNLALRVQQERPDLTVFVAEPGGDLIEVRAIGRG